MNNQSARDHMVKVQIARRGVHDARLLAAMRQVPREAFVAPGFEEFAYEDSALPIAEGQTISQPYIVAAMLAAADIETDDRVLEVGAGSGYAAAVLSRLAAKVFAIERHATLADQARERLRVLGYANVTLKVGDGSQGWPEQGPFDAIIVSAGSPSVPGALRQQLSVGGRLVIPVGDTERQRLMRVVRMDEAKFEEDDLGPVHFVRLLGSAGWPEDVPHGSEERQTPRTLPQQIADAAEPLPAFDDPNFGKLFDRFAHKRVVLLGEASHGTHEFYRARAAITGRLVREHGFNMVAVEADWPDAAAIDRHVRGKAAGPLRDAAFRRFPTWMWRNREFAEFTEWLRRHNLDRAEQCSFHGLDMYNMRGAIAAVLAYLDKRDPAAAAVARQRYGCLTPWQHEPSAYGRAVLTKGYRDCEAAVVAQCRAILEKEFAGARDNGDDFLDAAQNARLIASAERYYRIMYYGGADSWNLRDTHMFESLEHLFAWKGSSAKAVIWAHNSHIGDARETDMGLVRDEINIGQLCRERYGKDAALIGMGTDRGTVACASDWDGPMEIKQVRPSREDSYERLCHDAGLPRFLLDFGAHPPLAEQLAEPRLERFIGVIYRPETERQSHYAEAALPRQYDAFLWFDDTRAVEELGPERTEGVPDTYPFGL